MQKFGFIGLGIMGSAMAATLIRGRMTAEFCKGMGLGDEDFSALCKAVRP